MESMDKDKGAQQQGTQHQQMKKKRKEAFPYGNYRNYYGYRIDQDMDEDPRLKVLKKEWFEGKECLDIGCNNGSITIQIAKKFKVKSILGVDIDSNRIQDAHWHLRKFVKMNKDEKLGKSLRSKVSDSENSLGKNLIAPSNGDIKQRDYSSEDTDLFDIVSFRQENFVQSQHSHEKLYDTILCLSVTKWIHLNWGDDGLIKLFSRIWRQLNPGGIFVMEPQPWKSYERNYKTSETTAANYKQIMFPPQCFQEILLDKIGFRTVEDVTSSLSGSKTGFNRPILVFRK